MGTPDVVVPVLDSLSACPCVDLVGVYTQPPRPKSRGNQVQLSPVHVWAQERQIPVYHPLNFKNEQDIQDFKNLHLDVAVVAGYGLLLPEPILNAPRQGCLNIHPSILPRWRGPSPIQYTILSGDRQTGVSTMILDRGMDTGNVIDQKIIPLDLTETAPQLNDILWQMGAEMMCQTLMQISRGEPVASTPQPSSGVTYSKLLKKEEGRIDWHRPATEIDAQIRALTPWPGTYCENDLGGRFKIIAAVVSKSISDSSISPPGTVLDSAGHIQCGDQSILQILKIQPDNKKPMDVASAINGGYLRVGYLL
ncbi:MAG: methionyl-tRNA formyltransferase [Alphaproteobacteria bacterium]|nr:methionyl-tRNA formyltransferase [Alphaproteobacteria bacterium]